MTPRPRRAAVDPAPAGPAAPPGSVHIPPVAEPGTPLSPPLPFTVAGNQAPVTVPDETPASGPAVTGPSPAGGSLMAHGSPPAGSSRITAGPSLADLRAATMTEDRGPDSLDAHVRRLVMDLGLLRYHTHDARRSPKGFPDLVLCGPGGVLFRELKTQRGQVTAEQQQWLDALAAAGADVGVWRPEHLLSGQIARELAALAGLRGVG